MNIFLEKFDVFSKILWCIESSKEDIYLKYKSFVTL